MLSSAEQPWFSVIIQKYAHQLEKLPPEDRAEAEEADVRLISLCRSQQPLPTHLPILTLQLKEQAGFPSHPNLSTLEPAAALCPNTAGSRQSSEPSDPNSEQPLKHPWSVGVMTGAAQHLPPPPTNTSPAGDRHRLRSHLQRRRMDPSQQQPVLTAILHN